MDLPTQTLARSWDYSPQQSSGVKQYHPSDYYYLHPWLCLLWCPCLLHYPVPNTIGPIIWKTGDTRTFGVAWGMILTNAGPCRRFSLREGLKDTAEARSAGGTTAFRNGRHKRSPALAGANPSLPYPRVPGLRLRKPACSQLMEIPTGGEFKRSGERLHLQIDGQHWQHWHRD